jgi:F-box protein 1 (cyclin F)
MFYRFLGLEIITIREAAWLTDNTYKYEDVVRMMGEITATLQGKFRVRMYYQA